MSNGKNRFRVLVEGVVDAENEQAAEAEVLRKLGSPGNQMGMVQILEVEEEDSSFSETMSLPMDLNLDELSDQGTYTVKIEFTGQEAKHLYRLMGMIYRNLESDPDFSPEMSEARTVSKMIEALDESLGAVLHGTF